MGTQRIEAFSDGVIAVITTSYMGMHHDKPLAVAVYGAVLTLCGASFTVLRWVVNQFHLHDPVISKHNRWILQKSVFSTLLFASSIPPAYLSIFCSLVIFVLIPVEYFLPERAIGAHGAQG